MANNQYGVNGLQQFNLNLQQKNMNKTLRSSSLPQLKSLQQPSLFKHLLQGIPKLQKPNRPEHLVEMGSYVIDKQQLLGRGFCSSVFRAKHSITGELVAIKIVDFDRIKGAVQKRLIKHQIKSLHQLKAERNILRLYQVLTNKHNVAFVTQICKGSLLQRLKPKNTFRKQPLSRAETFKIIKQIMRGYYNMRQHNILHRDLKPANILMGSDGQARLGDFGFSIRDEQVQQDKHVNIGSPLYMAPQVLKGNNYSAKADLWSIGLIFLEMLIGDLPWATIKESRLHEKLLDINMSDVIPQDLQEKYKQMLGKCLETDPRKRIGVMQMMKYLFTKEQLKQLSKQSKCSTSQPSARLGKSSIPTNITQYEEQRITSAASVLPTFDRSKNTTAGVFSNNSRTFLKNPLTRSSKAASSRKMRLKEDFNNPSEGPLNMKLKLSVPQQRQSISKEQMSELHLCRFLFKMVQLIAKGEDNVHNTYFNMPQRFSVELAQCILFTLEEIRQIKSGFAQPIVRQFRKSKEFRKILELTEQFENNYVQFFQIQLKTEIEGRLIDPDYLMESMSAYVKNGTEHFELIFQQMEKSQLKMITDDEICQFMHLIDFMDKLMHFLRLRKKGRQNFVKYSKVEELANKPLSSVSLSELRKINQRIHD